MQFVLWFCFIHFPVLVLPRSFRLHSLHTREVNEVEVSAYKRIACGYVRCMVGACAVSNQNEVIQENDMQNNLCAGLW